MRIAGTQYSVQGRILEIFISGCAPPRCEGCHNPELWDFNRGDPWKDVIDLILKKIERFEDVIDHVYVVGGEPLDNHRADIWECFKQLRLVTWTYDVKLWLFTKYDRTQIPNKILYLFDYVKTGPYIEAQALEDYECCGIQLASANQRVLERGVDYPQRLDCTNS